MALKKQEFKNDEIPIFDEACVYKRGEYWQFRMWLAKENKYARKSLRQTQKQSIVKSQYPKPKSSNSLLSKQANPLGIDAIRLFEAERLLVSFRRQKNVLSKFQKISII